VRPSRSQGNRGLRQSTIAKLAWLPLVALALAAPACGGIEMDSSDPDGSVAIYVDVHGVDGAPLRWNEPVSYTVLGRAFNRSGMLASGNEVRFAAILGSIPPGENYGLALTSSMDGRVCDSGATFDVTPAQTTTLNLVLQCHR
jgi:hypothetical protein